MNIETSCPIPTGLCADESFRLAIYESGHALTARALGIKIIYVRMRPRPPVLASDKTISGNTIGALLETLENRVIELFGGQIAEEHVCDTNSCCSGDVARIDLEDKALEIFSDQRYRDAILPVAEFLHQQVLEGHSQIDGRLIDAELDKYVPALPKKKGLGSFLFGGK